MPTLQTDQPDSETTNPQAGRLDASLHEARHIVKLTSNLLHLQKTGKFCDVRFLCSDGYVEGKLQFYSNYFKHCSNIEGKNKMISLLKAILMSKQADFK